MRRAALLMVLMFVFAVSVSAQDTMPTPTATEALCFSHNGTIDEKTGQCQQHMNLDLKMDYPLELVDYPFITDAVDSYYEQVRLNFMNEAQSSGFAPSPVFNWELYVSYDIAAQTDSLISVIFYDYEFTGGAHGNTGLRSMTFDLKSERELTLADLFSGGTVPYDTIASYAAKTLEDRLGADATFPQGYTPDPANFQFWTLAPDGITFYFAQYQVAPYAAGIQKVTIPLADLGLSDLSYVSAGS